MGYLTKEQIQAQLPKIGDRRLEIMTMFMQHCGLRKETVKPQRCTVITVNREHLWYAVRFDNGFRECYKLPKPDGGDKRV